MKDRSRASKHGHDAMGRVWLRFVTRESTLLEGKVANAMKRSGIKTCRYEPGRPWESGVLFFEDVSPSLCDFVREVSRNGIERVLAIAVSSIQSPCRGICQLLGAGASDVLGWDGLEKTIARIAAKFERWSTVDRVVNSQLVTNNLVGCSSAWRSILRQTVEIAQFTDASVLIIGETGTGKELLARLIHTLDARPDKRDLVILDCATIVPELSGSEFFGHERGAFTGAVASRDGAFAMADGGTLFLDEVGELPPRLQAQLLRVIQEHTYKRVGGNTWHKTDFRLVCATNRDLLEDLKRRALRYDFFYRIAGWTCKIPPLRERTEDILPLTYHFIQQTCPDKDPIELDQTVREYLFGRAYPGNVRDLKQLVSRMIYRHVGPGPITVGDIPEEERSAFDVASTGWNDRSFERSIERALAIGVGLKAIGRAAEDAAVRIALHTANGNLQRAARRLGITARALQMRRAAHRRQQSQQEKAEGTNSAG